MRSLISEAMVLIVIVMASALLLSVVNAITEPVIEKNMDSNRIAMAREIFPEADRIKGSEVFQNNERIGLLKEVSRYGYSSEIKILVGFDSASRIKGIRILELQETPGLGSRIAEPWFTDQFIGKYQQMTLGVEIDGVTGATISSRAAVAAVNSAFVADPHSVKNSEDGR